MPIPLNFPLMHEELREQQILQFNRVDRLYLDTITRCALLTEAYVQVAPTSVAMHRAIENILQSIQQYTGQDPETFTGHIAETMTMIAEITNKHLRAQS